MFGFPCRAIKKQSRGRQRHDVALLRTERTIPENNYGLQIMFVITSRPPAQGGGANAQRGEAAHRSTLRYPSPPAAARGAPRTQHTPCAGRPQGQAFVTRNGQRGTLASTTAISYHNKLRPTYCFCSGPLRYAGGEDTCRIQLARMSYLYVCVTFI